VAESDLDATEREEVVDALARIPDLGPATDARIIRIGGLTNRNFDVTLGGERYVLRLAGSGTGAYIDRQVEAHNARVAAAAGVNAEVLFLDPADGTMLCRYIDALTMSVETFRDLARVERAARALRRMHAFTETFVDRFDVFAKIDEYLDLLRRHRARIPDGYGDLQKEAEVTREVLAARPAALAPCHNDPLAENFLDTGERMFVVDWEYAGLNDPMWDLGDVSVEADFGPDQDRALLGAYFGGAPPVEQAGRMVIYKALCDLVWTLWGLIQLMNDNPAEDFWAYSLGRFERCRRLMASPEFGAALEAVRRGPVAPGSGVRTSSGAAAPP
jgi:thiamine kinase-like enzyme